MKFLFFALLYNPKYNEYKHYFDGFTCSTEQGKDEFKKWVEDKLSDNKGYILLSCRII